MHILYLERSLDILLLQLPNDCLSLKFNLLCFGMVFAFFDCKKLILK